MYKEKSYVVRPLPEVLKDLEGAVPYADQVLRIFLADGDALGVPAKDLELVLQAARKNFPRLRRISAYANSGNLLNKTPAELHNLREAGLSLLYLGVESGSDTILKRVRKGALKAHHAEAIQKAREAGIDVSVMVITGLGEELSREHREETAELINIAPPHFLSTLSLMLSPRARAEFAAAFPGGFTELDDQEALEETRGLLALIDPPENIIFRSNHASNALALRGVLPRDREGILEKIDAALAGEVAVRPSWHRGL